MKTRNIMKQHFCRMISLICALVLSAAVFTACSGSSAPTAQEETQAPAEKATEAATEEETVAKLSFTNIDYEMPTTAPIEVPTVQKLSYANIDIDYDMFANKSYGADVDTYSGAVTLDASILFASDSYELSENGKTQLKSFLDDYCSATLGNSDNKDKIKKIAVEGHTDTDGSYDYNKTLSENRANAVLDFAVEVHPELKEYLYAVGRSYDDPVYNDDGTVNKEKSRRVVFIPET